MRRSIEIVVLAIITFPMWGGAIAEAGPLDASLRGDYSMTATRTCPIFQTPFDIRGTLTFNGTGAGSFLGEHLATVDLVLAPPSPGTLVGYPVTDNCTVSYTVNADGTFTMQMNCNLTVASGPNAGITATWNGIELPGQLALDGTVLLLTDTSTGAETFTITSGPLTGTTNQRYCSSSGVATSKR